MWTEHTHTFNSVPNNNHNTNWRGSVLPSEEFPPHSGEFNHALSSVGGPTQHELSRRVASGHHISMEHRLRRKHLQLNSDTNASNETVLKEIQEKRRSNILFQDEKFEQLKNGKHESGVTLQWTFPDPTLVHRGPKIEFSQKDIVLFTTGTVRRLFSGFGVCSDD